MQCHGEPTKYIFWGFGSAMFNTSWKHYNKEYFISEEMSTEDIAMRTIAIELAKNRTATTFYFDNIVFEIYHEDPSVVMLWNNIVTNSDLEGDDVSCFKATVKRGGENFIDYATIVDGAGKGNSRGIVVESKDNPPESWDTQFFVCLPQSLPAGTKYRFSFDHKASQDAPITMQCHDEPSDYIYYGFGGDFSITTSWGHYEHEGYITSEMSTDEKKMRTIAIDLAHNTTATTFYFDNIVFEIEQPQEEEDESVTITADSKAMTYGDDVPTLTFRFSGATLKGTPELSTTATKTSPVGKYPIKVERGTVTNEQVTFVDGTLTISKAALYVGVQDVTITEGDAIPSFDLTYRGFCNDDTEANAFTTNPKASTTATSSSKPGTYPITVSGGSATNYSLTYTQGTLTILAKAATTSWENIVKNSDLEGDDVSCFFVREDLAKDSLILNATIVNGAGKDNSRGIVVHSVDDASEGWNTQFFVRLPQSLPVGAKYRFSFDHKASQDASVNMEVHQEPSDYIYWGFGSTTCTTSWDHYENEGVVTLEMSTDEKQMRTIAIDLAGNATATTFYFDNIVFEVYNGQGDDQASSLQLSISSTGKGYVAYDGNTVRDKTSTFSVDKGTSAILKFIADDNNKLKSVKVNGKDVTSTIVNNQYTVSDISASTSIEVAFEAIPTYSLNIVASGNGKAVYGVTTIRNQSRDFTLQEGVSAVVSFTPDEGYRIKSVIVNNIDRTSQVSNGQITISNIKQDTNVEVSFEEIPPTTHSVRITASGNGSVTYDGNSVRGTTNTFKVVEGSYVTIMIEADEGYKLKSVKLNSKDVTADVANNQYTTDKITAFTRLDVEFEAIPSFSMTIKSSAFGSVKYDDVVISNRTETFTVKEGTSAVLTFMADDNGRLLSIMLNGENITSELTNGQYTISDIRSDQSIEAEFVVDVTKITDAGVAYTVVSYDEGTVVLAAGNYGQLLTVPSQITAKGKTWQVVGVADDALKDNQELAAIVWKPEILFSGEVKNPNLLLYVKADQYAPADITNVIVGNIDKNETLVAENVILTEAESGNNFYCPISFTAKHISYEHNYSMISGYNTCQGWETIVLPFDVSMIINAKGTEIVPYSTWEYGSRQRPFWLYQLTESGWQAAKDIMANTPYIISIPNNELYQSSYNIAGNIEFVGNYVEVKASDNMTTGRNGNKRFVANYQNKIASKEIYAMNVNNLWCQNTDTECEGSVFIRNLRDVHPFEAYMTLEGGNAPWMIPVFDNGVPTNIAEIERMRTVRKEEWYDLQGRKLQGSPTKGGIYIKNGKKIKK
jgi:carbon monoxide dehydrogenase subunit G